MGAQRCPCAFRRAACQPFCGLARRGALGRLPRVRERALAAGVNPNTMQRAMTELEREGLVFPQRTAGRFVTEDAELIAQARQTLAREQTEEFLSAMRSLGYAPGEISELIEALVKEDGNAQL